jgi:hypothetical protein
LAVFGVSLGSSSAMPPVSAGIWAQFQVDGPQSRLTRNMFPDSRMTPLPVLAVTVRLSLLPMSPFRSRTPPWPSIVRPAEFTQTPFSGATLLRQKTWSAKSVGREPAVAHPIRGSGFEAKTRPKKLCTAMSARTKTIPKVSG